MDVDDIVPIVREFTVLVKKSLDLLKLGGVWSYSDEQILYDIFKYIKESENLRQKVRVEWLLARFKRIQSEFGDRTVLRMAIAPKGLQHMICGLTARYISFFFRLF